MLTIVGSCVEGGGGGGGWGRLWGTHDPLPLWDPLSFILHPRVKQVPTLASRV